MTFGSAWKALLFGMLCPVQQIRTARREMQKSGEGLPDLFEPTLLPISSF